MIDLRCGDCLEIMKTMADKSVDISFTSPPYNRKRNDKYSNYQDIIADYFSFLDTAIQEMRRVTKKYVFLNVMPSYYNKKDVYAIIGKYANDIQNIIIWEKSNPIPCPAGQITNAYEMFIVFSTQALRSNTTYTKNHITTSVNSGTTTKIHKAVMKQEVADWFIEKFTTENDTVLDCFMGLGTTGISCVKSNRNFIGIEIDETYFNIAKERIEAERANKVEDNPAELVKVYFGEVCRNE